MRVSVLVQGLNEAQLCERCQKARDAPECEGGKKSVDRVYTWANSLRCVGHEWTVVSVKGKGDL